MRRKRKPYVCKGLPFYVSLCKYAGGECGLQHIKFWRKHNFFKWSETMTTLYNATLCVPAFLCCHATLRHAAPRQRHADDTGHPPRLRPATRLLLVFPVAGSQRSPKVRTCLQSLQADRVRAIGHAAFLDLIFNLLIPRGQMIGSGENSTTRSEIHKG